MKFYTNFPKIIHVKNILIFINVEPFSVLDFLVSSINITEKSPKNYVKQKNRTPNHSYNKVQFFIVSKSDIDHILNDVLNVHTRWLYLSRVTIRTFIFAIPNYAFVSSVVPPGHHWIIYVSVFLSSNNDEVCSKSIWWVELRRIKFVE